MILKRCLTGQYEALKNLPYGAIVRATCGDPIEKYGWAKLIRTVAGFKIVLSDGSFYGHTFTLDYISKNCTAVFLEGDTIEIA